MPSTEGQAASARGMSPGVDEEADALHAPDEEVKQTKTVRSPPMPNQEEIDTHRVSHLPY